MCSYVFGLRASQDAGGAEIALTASKDEAQSNREQAHLDTIGLGIVEEARHHC